MNLLTYQNRFSNTNLSLTEIAEGNGYTLALVDLLKWLEDKTQFDPANRMVNALDILEVIQETNEVLAAKFRETITTAKLSGEKVNSFLNETIQDLPETLYTSPSSVAWDEGMK